MVNFGVLELSKKYTMSHTLLVGLLLAFAGGYLDIYTYLCRGGVFANAETGNMVLMGVSIARFDFMSAINYLIPILAFAAGVVISEIVKTRFGNSGAIHWRQVILGVEIGALIVIAFVPSGKVENMIVNTIVSLVCSLQVQTFRNIRGNIIATTMCTGNLRSASEQFYLYKTTKDKSSLKKGFVYLSIIAMFIVGAIAGALLTGFLDMKSVFVPCGVLVIVFILIFVKGKVETVI